MEKIRYFLIILFSFNSCSEIPKTSLLCYNLVEDMGKMYLDEKLLTGSCYTVYQDENESIDEVRSYRKGEMHGTWAKYYENGQISYVGKAKNGQINGYYKKYRENGLLSEEGFMKEGSKDKVWKYYDLAGNLEKKERYKDQYLIDEMYTNPQIQKYIDEN